MVFRKGGHLSHYEKWFYGDIEIKITNSYKYLGMLFTTKLSLKKAVAEYCRKGRKGVIVILKTLRKLNAMDSSIFWKLFNTQIEPVLTYGAELWGIYDNIDLEKVHTFAIKRFLNVPLHSSNTVVYGETGRYPLYVRTYVKCIKYWLKLLKLPISRLSRQAYQMLLNEHEKGKENWAYCVKNILATHGFGIVWLCQGVGSEGGFIMEFKNRIIDSYRQNWHSKIESSDRYNWYYSFKDTFEAEKYITVVNNRWHRICLARFRSRTIGLNAHKQWFHDDDISLIAPCPMCGFYKEDDIHFLFSCKTYDVIRKKCKILEKHVAVYLDLVGVLKMNYDDESIKSLAKYIAEALNIRTKQKQIQEEHRQNVTL
jgi:hypothetical protein